RPADRAADRLRPGAGGGRQPPGPRRQVPVPRRRGHRDAGEPGRARGRRRGDGSGDPGGVPAERGHGRAGGEGRGAGVRGGRAEMVFSEQLGYGITSYGGGLPERLYNVELASRRLNGVLVPPDGVYSFNEALGPATIENGFKWGFGIVDDGSGRMTTVPAE